MREVRRELFAGSTDKLDPIKFFTEPHYNRFPAVLINLPAVTVRELEPLIKDAWRRQAPTDLNA